jgi:hypothetical protein
MTSDSDVKKLQEKDKEIYDLKQTLKAVELQKVRPSFPISNPISRKNFVSKVFFQRKIRLNLFGN